jgi:zinc-ribbon domain
MNCEHCGAELPQAAKTCPACGKEVGLLTKTGDVAERTGEVTVDVGKKVGKGALKLGGKALTGIGSLSKKAGKKLEGEEEEK